MTKHFHPTTSSRPTPLQSDSRSDMQMRTKVMLQNEISKLKAQCDDLELQLEQSRLYKRQADLSKALSLELQHNNCNMAAIDSGTIITNASVTKGVQKSKQIVDHLFLTSLDSIEEEGYVVDIGNGAKLQFYKKKIPLSQVSIEQWGFASLSIMKELIRTGDLAPKDINGYVSYTQSIFRLASNHVWHSVLLYDKEYRDSQIQEGFKWGEPQKDLHDFHLVPKPNSLTMKTLNSMSAKSLNKETFGFKPQAKKRGPFMPDGREICRKFNSGICDFQRCRMAHNCAICFSREHKAVDHSIKENVYNQQNSMK